MLPNRFLLSPRLTLLAIAIGVTAVASSLSVRAAEPSANSLDAYLPAEGVRAVVAVGDAPRAWQALDAAGLGDAMLPAFRGAFGSLEWALVASPSLAEKDAKGAKNGKSARNAKDGRAAAEATLLCLARVADPETLRTTLPTFEQAVAVSLGTGGTQVGRTEEAIGDVTVVVMTNGEHAVGFLLSGRAGVWASCTDADLLRATARLIARDAKPAPAGKSALADARAAAAQLRKEGGAGGGADAPILVLLPASGADASASLGAVDWLRAVLGAVPSRPVVAAVSPEERALRVEVLAVGAAPQAAGEAAKSVAEFPPMGDLCATPGGALLQWGTSRLDPEAMRQAIMGEVDRSLAELPPPNSAGLTPDSDLQRQRLGGLRSAIADAQRWPAELGPEAWVLLNRFEFAKPGELPAVDLVAAVRTRDEAATRAHLADWEARLLAAVAPQAAAGASAPAVARGGKPAGSTGATPAPRFSERDEKLSADGQTARLRWLDAPALPAVFRPAWALRGDLLCVALSPDSLAAALRGAAAVAPQAAAGAASLAPSAASPGRALVQGLGLPRPGAALAAWPARSAALASVLRVLGTNSGEPWMTGLLNGAADRWSRAESVAVAREDDPDGVRTVARVVLTAVPAAAPAPAPATAKKTGEAPAGAASAKKAAVAPAPPATPKNAAAAPAAKTPGSAKP